jgi:hypothetical protein
MTGALKVSNDQSVTLLMRRSVFGIPSLSTSRVTIVGRFHVTLIRGFWVTAEAPSGHWAHLRTESLVGDHVASLRILAPWISPDGLFNQQFNR